MNFRIFLFIPVVTCFILETKSQDIIYTNYGSTIRAKIVSNTDTLVTYYSMDATYGSFNLDYSQVPKDNPISYIPKKYITKIKFQEKEIIKFNNPIDSLTYTLADTIVSVKKVSSVNGQSVTMSMLQKLSKNFPKARREFNGASALYTISFGFAYFGGVVTGASLGVALFGQYPEALIVTGFGLGIIGISIPFTIGTIYHVKKGAIHYNNEVKSRALASKYK